jgi:outer membrane protein assembly factor BamD (BamD/ComL family)
LEQALFLLEESLKGTQEDCEMLLEMSQICLKQKNYAKAKLMLERVLQINPRHTSVSCIIYIYIYIYYMTISN